VIFSITFSWVVSPRNMTQKGLARE